MRRRANCVNIDLIERLVETAGPEGRSGCAPPAKRK
jgi:hypothetical protein